MSRQHKPRRRRRRLPELTQQQRLEIELRRCAAEQKTMARRERYAADLVECVGSIRIVGDDLRGERYGRTHAMANDFDQWELAELSRRNARAKEPTMWLQDDAYEAKRLMRYVE